jgi:Holliday junction resolvasome RuvABC endonuclease subunit
MKIIGIDPGLTKTGVGIIEIKNNTYSFVAAQTIYSKASDPRKILRHQQSLNQQFPRVGSQMLARL